MNNRNLPEAIPNEFTALQFSPTTVFGNVKVALHDQRLSKSNMQADSPSGNSEYESP